jgi:hypothetical protein
MGSEKSADQAWDFLSSWFVMRRFYRGRAGRFFGCAAHRETLARVAQARRNAEYKEAAAAKPTQATQESA